MCLYDTKRFRINGIKPIKVYKVVRERDDKLRTPYEDAPFKKVMFGGLRPPIKHPYTGEYCFEGGFIHACLTFEYACTIGWHINNKIFTGYVPPFARYAIEGDYGICSRWMIFTKERRT